MRVLLALTVVTVVGLAGTPTLADEDDGIGKIKTGVPNAVTPVPNSAQPSLIDPDFALGTVATGTEPLENPSGPITKFGLLSTNVPTEPDENLYLGARTQSRRTDRRFQLRAPLPLSGPRERGAARLCDAHQPRRAPRGSRSASRCSRRSIRPPTRPDSGSIDGSTYDPFTNTLLFTQQVRRHWRRHPADGGLAGAGQHAPSLPRPCRL